MKRYIATLSLTFILLLLQTPSCFSQTISTVAGNGTAIHSGDGGPASLAGIRFPGCISFDREGNYYIVGGDKVRKVSLDGIITTIAGTGSAGYSGDGGPATLAEFNGASCMVVDSSNNIYISDYYNNRIRKIDASSGTITTIAGNGLPAFTGDGGPAISASINGPQGLSFDRHANLYFADYQNHRIRRIDTAGLITTVAGNGVQGYLGDGGPALAAQMYAQYGIRATTDSIIYVADGYKVRKVNVITGIITSAAGNGTPGFSGDGGTATSAQLNVVSDIAINSEGDLFISDRNNRIRKVNSSGIITTIVGNGVATFSGDGGAATTASIYSPRGIEFDQCDNLYIADNGNNRIRKVTFNPPTTSTINITGIAASPLSTTVTINATVSGAGGSYSIRWFNKGVQFASTTVPLVTYTKTQDVDSITARLVPTIMYCYDSSVSGVHVVTKTPGGVAVQGVVVVSVYPNPGGDVLYVSGGEIAEVVDLVGSVVASGKDQIDVSGLASGVYVVRVYGVSGWVSVVRWVKR